MNDVLRALIQTGGNRSKAAKKLGIVDSGISGHINKIMQLSEEQLQNYADTLEITIPRIKGICAPLRQAKKRIFAK